ncbi:MAG: aminomethyl-transferring glycine dehydrogenase [Granulosicoccaceae bacterium]
MQHSNFVRRHIGPSSNDQQIMLNALGVVDLKTLIDQVVPDNIQSTEALALSHGSSESDALAELASIASKNIINKSMLGQGYYGCHLPSVIKRNVLENPSWYTAYTPYQPEIAQGRLEVLFNFQTLITELTALPMANASLLDEGTAAAEAMTLAHRALRGKRNTMLVAGDCHAQTIDILNTRAEPLGITVTVVANDKLPAQIAAIADDIFAVLIQYPGTNGDISQPEVICKAAKGCGAIVIVAADLLALTLLPPPGEWGADIAVGSAQRFGVPMGFGGPHAAYMATSDKHKRNLPGRLIGQSITANGEPAYRLALQTREQHIRREKATSNICTAQALLAIIATLYACYHGPDGLRDIASSVRAKVDQLVATLKKHKLDVLQADWFDTVSVEVDDADKVLVAGHVAGINIRKHDATTVVLSFDETTSLSDVATVASLLVGNTVAANALEQAAPRSNKNERAHNYLSQACFHEFHSETEMMRYLRRLANKDLALDTAMIPLGSCTMKLNAASEMIPISWPEFTDIHPFAPQEQSVGYREMIAQLESMLCACTGYDAMSLQPNAGSQGEYAGLLAIKAYHASRGEAHRNVCLIPSSAHGTNPASAQMAGLKVVVCACDDQGNVDDTDLQAKINANEGQIAAVMITYPSTHGVFEAGVRDVCERVHAAGGQVYIDGANLNAMVGTAQPGKFGGDVSHLNLHKTFCIPHGGGGPGIGPIGVGKHLEPFLPGHRELGDATGVVSAAPWGSAMILPITWMYIRMMGARGLRSATEVAILSANYIAHRLSPVYPILYRGENDRVAHECIIDTRPLKDDMGITVDDIAKRLMDYGFHAPTMSFPVPGTLMIEPTESESLSEVDRFCEAMLAIYAEAKKVKDGEWTADDNPLVNAPHTATAVTSDVWAHAYTRQQAAYPSGNTDGKYWPPVARIDNVHGDKHLICSCPPLSTYQT